MEADGARSTATLRQDVGRPGTPRGPRHDSGHTCPERGNETKIRSVRIGALRHRTVWMRSRHYRAGRDADGGDPVVTGGKTDLQRSGYGAAKKIFLVTLR